MAGYENTDQDQRRKGGLPITHNASSNFRQFSVRHHGVDGTITWFRFSQYENQTNNRVDKGDRGRGGGSDVVY